MRLRRKALIILTLLQIASPSTVGAAAAVSNATPVAPLAPIFVSDPLPEFSVKHAAQEPWNGHQQYHEKINAKMRAWENDFHTRQVTPPYTQEKRTFLRFMLTEHRKAHAVKQAPITTVEDDAVFIPDSTENDPVDPGVSKPAGRAALFTALPKMSHRQLESRMNKIINNN